MTTQSTREELDVLFDTLSAEEVASVAITFSGGNDEGGADGVTVTYGDGRQVVHDDPYRSEPAWLTALADLPQWLYLSFAGEYSVVGTITLTVTSRTVELDGTEQTWLAEDVLYATDDFIRECDDNRAWLNAIRGESRGN